MRRSFAHYDAELDGSDQTIFSVPRVIRSKAQRPNSAILVSSGLAVDGGESKLRRKRSGKSAFFSDTTDEDDNRARKPTFVPFETHSLQRRMDRRHLADALTISTQQIVPQFRITADALKQIYEVFKQQRRTKTLRTSNIATCYMYGDGAMLGSKVVDLTGVAVGKDAVQANSVNAWWVPVYFMDEQQTLKLSKETYISAISEAHIRYSDESQDFVSCKLQPKLLIATSPAHEAQLEFRLECPMPSITFQFTLIRNLPLLMTPLAVSLSRREFGTSDSTRRSGYLTLDRARKAVPLLKSDPLVLQRPIVGIWAYGIPLDDEWNDETARLQLADPFLYFACIGYLLAKSIKEKVELSLNTFLVALYPTDNSLDGRTVSPLPRFFECSVIEPIDTQKNIMPMDLYAYERSCLAGVPRVTADIEVSIAISSNDAWHQAKEELDIPTFPRQIGYVEDNEQNGSQTEAQRRIRSDDDKSVRDSFPSYLKAANGSASPDNSAGTPRPGSPRDTTMTISTKNVANIIIAGEQVQDSAERDEHVTEAAAISERQFMNTPIEQNPDIHNAADLLHDRRQSDRSTSSHFCCKSQQLLSIQHQQILENQQKQLHEMQEQIAQLRRLLNVSTNIDTDEHLPRTFKDDIIHSDELRTGIIETERKSEMEATDELAASKASSSGSFRTSQGDKVSASPSIDHDHEPDHHMFDGDEDDEAKKEYDDENSSMSSLHLSSLSNESLGSELSSLSSSLVGTKKAGGIDSARYSPIKQSTEEPQLQNGNKVEDGEDTTPIIATNHGKGRDQIDSIAEDDTHEDDDSPVVERLLMPDSYLEKIGGLVDHHRGCFTAPTSDLHSFCVPRIKFNNEPSYLSDSEDEEIRLIELKYKKLMLA